MQISSEELRNLIIQIAKMIEEKGGSKTKKKMYVIATQSWNEKYGAFFNSKELSHYEAYAVIPEEWQQTDYLAQLVKAPYCKGIVLRNAVSLDEVSLDEEDFVSVFPMVPTNLIVKTALCLEDDFETMWIASCFRQGKSIVFMKPGLQKFTGKEPEAYVNRMMDYYRLVLSYDIVLADSISQAI